MSNKKSIKTIGSVLMSTVLIIMLALTFAGCGDDDSDKIDLSKYLTFKFNDTNGSVTEGSISGEFTFDSEQFAKDQDMKAEDAQKLLEEVQKNINIQSKKADGNWSFLEIKDANSNDEFEVMLRWPNDTVEWKISRDRIEKLEKDYDVSFDQSETTTKIKLADELKKQNITVK